MKVEISVSSGSVILKVDTFSLDVYKDLESEYLPDANKKFMWISSLAYELDRRLSRLRLIDKRIYMSHWRIWATKWVNAQGMKDLADNVDSAVAYLFSLDTPVSEKIKAVCSMYSIYCNKKWDTWKEFFKDESDSLSRSGIKDKVMEVYKFEIQQDITYTSVIDNESRLQFLVSTLQSIADAYKKASYRPENKMSFGG